MRRTLLISCTATMLLVSCGSTPTPTPALPTSTPTLAPSVTATPVPLAPTATATAVPPTQTALEAAVSALRRLDFNSMDESAGEALEDATTTIIEAGSQGARMLKQELAVIEQSGEKDSSFQLVAAWILWDIGQLDEAETIAAIWSTIPATEWRYTLLFMPAQMAASTQDPRALPMLRVLMSDKNGTLYNALRFPLTHELLWGPYGSKGLPVLHEILQTSDDPTMMESAIHLLSISQYLPALPDIRKALNSQHPGVRETAIFALGRFGHPDDYDLLLAGLDSADVEERYVFLRALVEFGDVRAVPHIIPLLDSPDYDTRQEATWGLGDYLASPESLDALKAIACSTPDAGMVDLCEELVQNVLDSAGLTWKEYKRLSPKAQERVTDGFRFANITLKEGEEPITHDELLEVVAEWRETGRIGSVKWAWVETRHILPIATGDDIDLLLDGKAMFYLRLSDECLYEVWIVNDLIKWIGRSRHR